MRTIRPEFYLAFASGHATFLGLHMLVLGTHPIIDGLWAIGTATMGTLFLSVFPRAPQKAVLVAAIALTILMSHTAEVPQRITELQKLVIQRPTQVPQPDRTAETQKLRTAVQIHIAGMNSGEPLTRTHACAEFRLFCADNNDHRCDGYLERCEVVTSNPWRDPQGRKWSE
ncbi:MAG: hypothetical protein R3E66_07045 [bacterium]